MKELDFTDCETLDKTFIADHYKETESDIIYKVKFKGRDAYLVILLEFQSTVDRFMVLRTGGEDRVRNRIGTRTPTMA